MTATIMPMISDQFLALVGGIVFGVGVIVCVTVTTGFDVNGVVTVGVEVNEGLSVTSVFVSVGVGIIVGVGVIVVGVITGFVVIGNNTEN